MSTWEVSART